MLQWNKENKLKFKPHSYIYDIEANSLNPDIVWCVVLRNVRNPHEVIKFHPKEEGVTHHDTWKHEFRDWIEGKGGLENITFIGHNIITYDNPVIERLLLPEGDKIPWNNVVDTLIISKTLKPSRLFEGTLVAGHGLEDWGERLGEPKTDFHEWDKFSFKMLDYCVQDTLVNYRVLRALLAEKKEIGCSDLALWGEMYSSLILYEMHTNGFLLDVPRAEKLVKDTRAYLDDYLSQLQKAFPPKRKDLRTFTPRMTKLNKMHGQDARSLESNLHEENLDSSFTTYEMVDFNPNSSLQKGDRLLALGWKPTKYTDKGNISTDKEAIKSAIEQLEFKVPEVKLLGDYTKLLDRNQSATKWLELRDENDYVHGRCNSIGAWTHRSSHFDDNMANIAKVQEGKSSFEELNLTDTDALILSDTEPYSEFSKDKYLMDVNFDKRTVEYVQGGLKGGFGWECRGSWIAPRTDKETGKHCTLLGVDASGIQLRALAHYMDDEEYIYQVCDGDIHVTNQKAAGIDTRPKSKTFIYAWLLGAGDALIGNIVGVESKDEEKELVYKNRGTTVWMANNQKEKGLPCDRLTIATILKGKYTKKRFLDNLPALKHLKNVIIQQAVKDGYMTGMDGRIIQLPNAHLAMGAYLQGFEAVILKHAMIYWYLEAKKKGIYFKLNAYVHDEWQITVEKERADELKQIVINSIKKVGYHLGSKCPLDGDGSSGRGWNFTH